MRAERPTFSLIVRNSSRKNALLPTEEGIERLSLAIAFGCCIWASSKLPPTQFASVVVLAILIAVSGDGGQRTRLLRDKSLCNAGSLIFETMVTLMALSMRLSPLERDFVAASLLKLLYRF